MTSPVPVPRYCSGSPTCGNTVKGQEQYCPEHKRAVRHHERRHYTGTPGINYGRPWRRQRALFLARNPYCVDCGAVLDLEVDHQIPHEGDPGLFWDQANWRTRCKSCHSTKTAREVAAR